MSNTYCLTSAFSTLANASAMAAGAPKQIATTRCHGMNISAPAQSASIDRLARARKQHGLRDLFPAALLINNDMAVTNVAERSATSIGSDILEAAVRQNVLIMRTIDLLFLLNHLEKSPNKKARMLHLLTSGGGWLKASTGSYDVIHP